MQEQPSIVSVCCAGCGFQVSQVRWLVMHKALVMWGWNMCETWTVDGNEVHIVYEEGLIRFSGKRLSLRSFPSSCYSFEFLPVRWVKGLIFVFECFEFQWCLYLEYREVEFHFIPAIVLSCVWKNFLYFFPSIFASCIQLTNPLSCCCALKYHIVWGQMEMLWSLCWSVSVHKERIKM